MINAREHIYDTCVQNDDGAVSQIYTYQAQNIAYCPVAKVGSTFWKRVLLFLHNDTGKFNVDSPFQIPRFFTHYGPKKRMKRMTFDVISREFISKQTRFMFVRNPYSRLWSAYLDKFFLPDFWGRAAKAIVALRKEKQKLKSKVCGHDVTFLEFLKYVLSLKEFLSNPAVFNEHWRPIQYMCNPCQYRPHFIGKLETFSQDSKHIIKQLGIEHIFANDEGSKYQIEEELKTLVDYNFKRITMREVKDCLTPNELAVRLWTVFEFNGYLPFGSRHVLNGTANMTADAFLELVLKTRRLGASYEDRWKRQRLSTLESAYKTVPDDVMTGLKDLYKMDFVHFNYDPDPFK
ncbi:hypothetical protein LOTGIDRAFT_104299 [Lottia gigantea]|uniref:Carbohydrate sulfotransferase n=1 Tax=Lottia gigantea TaxID=225164 RepID=V4C7B6_LOTGI|nr:hypothetical protein LOTGIDRAFT_104299 [Lottia gigantea]ESO97579.1 hypothetical protein LOTGIDRAFT_104299 [Lottia gigantea]